MTGDDRADRWTGSAFRASISSTSTHMARRGALSKENPWERIRIIRALMPRTPLQFIATGMRFISWEMRERRIDAARLLAVSCATAFAASPCMDPMNDVDAMTRSRASSREVGVRSVVGALTYTVSSSARRRVFRRTRGRTRRVGRIRRVYLKDPGGLLDARARAHADAGDPGRNRRADARIAFALQYRAGAVLLSRRRRSSASTRLHVAVGPLGQRHLAARGRTGRRQSARTRP